MIEKIRNNPRLKQFVIGLISPHKHPRPRLWVRWFVNPFVTKKAAVAYPRSYRDYDAVVKLDKVPSGVRIGFKPDPFSPIVWDALPDGEDWFCRG